MTASGIQLSVLIATHDRRELLRRCLDSLATQTADPASFEVVVADDGSSDGSAEMVEALSTPYRLRLLRLSKGGQAAAQNAAVEAAEAAVCLTLDDDVIASPQLVAAHAAAHREDPRTIGIGPLTQARAGGDWFSEAFSRGWAEHYEGLAERPARWNDCFGANVSLPRQQLREVGGIATDLDAGFDLEVALRLCDAGCVPRFLPAARGLHDDAAKGRNGVLRDAWRQGATFAALRRRHPGRAGQLLEWSRGASQAELRLRRLALAARVSPGFLARLGRALPGTGRRMIWLHFVLRVAVWRGVRDNVGESSWRALTLPAPATPPATSARAVS